MCYCLTAGGYDVEMVQEYHLNDIRKLVHKIKKHYKKIMMSALALLEQVTIITDQFYL